MRRMNSMLLGHQGASARTDCMYLRDGQPRRRVVPGQRQVHDARWAPRCRRVGGQRRLAARRAASSSASRRQHAGVVVDLQRADAGREVDDAGQAARAAAPASSACTRKRSSRSSTMGPYSTSRYASPAWRIDDRAARRRRRRRDARRIGVARAGAARRGVPARRAASRSRAPARAQRAARLRRATRHEAHAVAGLAAGRSSRARRCDDRRRADEAAEARAVGAEDDRHVAGEVDGADGVGVVVDVGRVQAGLAAVACAPTRASGRSGARRCGSEL